MSLFLKCLASAFCLMMLTAGPASSKRIALVVGIDNYQNLPANQQLKKARNDARAMAATLGKIGFKVTAGEDLSRSQINLRLQRLANAIEPGDVVAVFFAGHGVAIDDRNFLLPSDVPKIGSGDRDFLKSEAIPADRIVKMIQGRGARIALVILDACRDDPFASSNGRSVLGTRGLSRMDPPQGAFVLFSAGAGQQALDRLPGNDNDVNSVFTRKLLPLLEKKGLELGQLGDLVQQQVHSLAKSVGHVQTPAVYDQVIGNFYLNGEPVAAAQPAPGENAEAKALREQLARMKAELDKSKQGVAALDQLRAELKKQRDAIEALNRKKNQQAALQPQPAPQPAPSQPATETPTEVRFMPRWGAGVRKANELDGATMCVRANDPSHAATDAYFKSNNMFAAYKFGNNWADSISQFSGGQCDVLVGTYAQLSKALRTLPNQGGDIFILSDLIPIPGAPAKKVVKLPPAPDGGNHVRFILRTVLGVTSALQLDGAAVCMVVGSAGERAINAYFRAKGMNMQTVVMESWNEVTRAYDSGRCDLIAAAPDAVKQTMAAFNKPREHMVLPELIPVR